MPAKKKGAPKRITARLEYLAKDDPELVAFIATEADKNERSLVAQLRAMIRQVYEQSKMEAVNAE